MLISTLQPVVQRSERRPEQPASSCMAPARLARTFTMAVVASRTCHTQRSDRDVCMPTCAHMPNEVASASEDTGAPHAALHKACQLLESHAGRHAAASHKSSES